MGRESNTLHIGAVEKAAMRTNILHIVAVTILIARLLLTMNKRWIISRRLAMELKIIMFIPIVPLSRPGGEPNNTTLLNSVTHGDWITFNTHQTYTNSIRATFGTPEVLIDCKLQRCKDGVTAVQVITKALVQHMGIVQILRWLQWTRLLVQVEENRHKGWCIRLISHLNVGTIGRLGKAAQASRYLIQGRIGDQPVTCLLVTW